MPEPASSHTTRWFAWRASSKGLPHRYGAPPSAYTFSFYGPSALAGLPAQWVSDGRPGRRRIFGAARHLAVVAEERARTASPAHQTALPANLQADTDRDLIGSLFSEIRYGSTALLVDS